MFRLFDIFRSPRRRAVDACIREIIHDLWPWIVPPTVMQVAVMLCKRMEGQGIVLSLDKACNCVESYLDAGKLWA